MANQNIRIRLKAFDHRLIDKSAREIVDSLAEVGCVIVGQTRDVAPADRRLYRLRDVTGAVELPEGTEMVMPGDNIKIVVELIAPIAMEQGLRFAIREGGKTVGAGVVAKVIA